MSAPDVIRVYGVERCGCGQSLSSQAVIGYERRQVMDIPAVQAQVTEHRAESKRCHLCGAVNAGEFPEGVEQQVQYGSRL